MKATQLLAAALVTLGPAVAAAEPILAADFSAVFPNNDDFSTGVGFQIDGRLGYQLPFPGLMVIPEVDFGWVNFSSPDKFPNVDHTLFRVMGGARAGMGTIFKGAIFGHIGYGNIDVTGADQPPIERAPQFLDDEGVAVDAGVALDLALFPLIDVGIHGAYNEVFTDNNIEWWDAGVHASLSF